MTRALASILNGQKGGRPKADLSIKVTLPEIELVVLTPEQHSALVQKYGDDLITKALRILDSWLKSGSREAEKYIGKNNYAHFRSDGWVINSAKQA